MFGNRSAVQFLDHLLGVRSLNLVAVRIANHRLAHRAGGRAVVVDRRHIVSAGLGMELNPVGGRSAADEHQLVLFQMEQNAVADHIAVVAAGHELLGAVDGELGEAVDREMGEQLEGVGPFDVDVHHVVRLVEEHAGLAPGALFIAPVA